MSSVASRLARLNRRIGEEDRQKLREIACGASLSDIASGIVRALDPDARIEAARKETGAEEPTPEQIERASKKLLDEAAKPLAGNPPLRQRILAVKSTLEQTIDTVSQDELLSAGYSAQAREKAQKMIESFEQFIRDNKDEITALQVLYSRPYRQRLTYPKRSVIELDGNLYKGSVTILLQTEPRPRIPAVPVHTRMIDEQNLIAVVLERTPAH